MTLTTLITTVISFLLTIMVLSYLFGDNPLFRFATHIFIGVSAGYVAVVAIYQVIWPYLILPILSADTPMIEKGLLVIPLVLSLLLLTKASPRLSGLGGPAVGYLVGVGAATAIGGAVLGTLLPQSGAAISLFDTSGSPNILLSLFNAIVLMVATVSTLAYFHFGARRQADGSTKRNGLLEAIAWFGQLFVALTLGVLFAGVYSAALTALIERIHSLIALFGLF